MSMYKEEKAQAMKFSVYNWTPQYTIGESSNGILTKIKIISIQ